MTRDRGEQPLRIAVLGLGAIGQRVLASLPALAPDAALAVFCRAGTWASLEAPPSVHAFSNVAQLEEWDPDLAVECAGHAVVADVVPRLLAGGTDVLIASVGALVDTAVRTAVAVASRAGGGRLLTVAGAIGGLDALAAARSAGLSSVRYIGRKPPNAWRGTPAEAICDLSTLTSAVEIFNGSAALSARLYPKNANVTAAVALAGVGFEQTAVSLVADPAISSNVHELEAHGAFGHLLVRMENEPLPENPRTSMLAVLSIESELRKWLEQRHPVAPVSAESMRFV